MENVFKIVTSPFKGTKYLYIVMLSSYVKVKITKGLQGGLYIKHVQLHDHLLLKHYFLAHYYNTNTN